MPAIHLAEALPPAAHLVLVHTAVRINASQDPTAAELGAFVGQAGRVLRSGGTYVGTWFLVDEASRDVLSGPAATVASEERVMRRILDEASLELVALHPGSWRAPGQALTYQDVVIARKVRA